MRCVVEARRALSLVLATMIWCCPLASWALSYPIKPVRYVVPFPAGASPDIVARLRSERFSKLWGQQVLVDNRSGAGGTVGAAYVAKSPPDGYTLFQCNVASSGIAPSLYAKPGYDQLRDFASISRIGMTARINVVHIRYKGAPQVISDVIGGQIPSGISNGPALPGPIQTGRVRALVIKEAKIA